MKAKPKFTVGIERDEEGFYVATVPGLPGCHTQAKNLEGLLQRAREVDRAVPRRRKQVPADYGDQLQVSAFIHPPCG